MKREYHEGAKAAERFEKVATQIFRSPKSSAKPVHKKAVIRKTKGSAQK